MNWKYSIVILLVAFLINPLHVMGAPSSLEKGLAHQASIAYNNGAYVKTIFLLKQALKLDPNNPKLLTNLGSAENEISNFISALSFYRQALKLDPHHIGALLGIGATLEMTGNHSSITYLKEALREPVSTTIGKLDRAVVLIHLHNLIQAMLILNQLKPSVDTENVNGVIISE